MKGARARLRALAAVKATKRPKESKAWLATVKGPKKRALKHLLLRQRPG